VNPPGAVSDPTAVADQRVTLACADGVATPAYVAHPARVTEPLPGMVVVIHGLGLDAHMEDVTRRFAGQGMVAIAADTFARIGGPPDINDRDQIMAKIGAMDDRGALNDLTAAVEWLRAQPECTGQLGGIGFCMGGRLLLMLATEGGRLDRAIDCWGGRMTRRTQPVDAGHPEVPIERIGRLDCPLLGIFGEDDTDPNLEDVAGLRAALERHGKSFRIRTFPGAGHAFFADTRPSYREEQASAAWEEFQRFLAPIMVAPA
jgi:carboxymethylenebutenolidase